MGYAVLAFDAEDAGAAARRDAMRDRHRAVISEWAAAGRLAFGVPLFTDAWKAMGSLMILDVPDRAGLDAYLAAEPFAREGVWQRITVHPFRIAPLPYQLLPRPGTPTSANRTHTIAIAFDGGDAGADARRQAARAAHMENVSPWATAGLLAIGGAILDRDENRMIGSIAVTAHPDDAAARAAWAEDPYVRDGVWRDVTLWGTRIAPLPYRALPGTPGSASGPSPLN
ncbi:MAG TPA: YciI family protein [Roseomonas sp.]|jgi:uncharacterized protein YciI